MNQNKQVVSANNAKVVIDGAVVGSATGLTYTMDTGLEAQYGIGSAEPYENVPSQVRYDVSVDTLVLRKDVMIEKGIVPQNAQDVTKGHVFDLLAFNDDGSLFAGAFNCSFGSCRTSINANRVIARSLSLKPLGMKL